MNLQAKLIASVLCVSALPFAQAADFEDYGRVVRVTPQVELFGTRTQTVFGVGDPNAGQTENLDAITAVVLGGTSLFGGRGGIPNTIIGLFVLGVLNNGLDHIDIDSFLKSRRDAVRQDGDAQDERDDGEQPDDEVDAHPRPRHVSTLRRSRPSASPDQGREIVPSRTSPSTARAAASPSTAASSTADGAAHTKRR